MVAEASEAVNNSKASPLIVMNNEEEADLSLSSVIFSAGMIVWSIVEKISLSIALSFSALTYPYSICLPYYLFTFCYKLLLLLQPIFPDVTLSLLLFGLYIMHSKSFVALVIGTNWNKNLVEFVPYL